MKKILILLLAALMACTVMLTACGNNNDDVNNDNETNGTEGNAPETEGNAPATEGNAPSDLPFANAEELVGQLVALIPVDQQIPGGGAVIELGTEDAGYTLTDLGLPEELHGKIDGAYQYRHMMNANSFSMGVYHFTNADDAADSVEAIKNTVLGKMWMCGFPEKVVVMTLPGNYVISIYGLAGIDAEFNPDFIGPVVTAAQSLVEGVTVVVDEPIL